ncbi:hypothetical protein BGZ63DRAFT_401320 [Mariannaea sp. PMI_226]|nr:hypothetical protein BGZ63DRAFT_401320 [Mariannaea sp. PMI_226]
MKSSTVLYLIVGFCFDLAVAGRCGISSASSSNTPTSTLVTSTTSASSSIATTTTAAVSSSSTVATTTPTSTPATTTSTSIPTTTTTTPTSTPATTTSTSIPITTASTSTPATTTSTSAPVTTTSTSAPATTTTTGPCPTYPQTGKIKVYNTDNTLLGYVRNFYDGQRSLTVGTLAQALEVQLSWDGDACANPTDISLPMQNLQDADASAHNHVGLVGGSGGYSFRSGAVGYAYMAGSAYTSPNSPPQYVGNSIQSLGYNAPSESSVWTFDSSSGALSLKWTNAAGGPTAPNPATIAYDPLGDYLFGTGDIDAFNSAFGEGAYAVSFVFVQDP